MTLESDAGTGKTIFTEEKSRFNLKDNPVAANMESMVEVIGRVEKWWPRDVDELWDTLNKCRDLFRFAMDLEEKKTAKQQLNED